MSTFTYLVTVDTDRDSGLIASRDEQSERITAAIEEAVPEADLSGIGARSDSEYSVGSVSVWEMDKKDLKEFNAEYEAAVVAAAPSDAEMRAELKALRAELAAANARVVRAEQAAETAKRALLEERPKSRIWQGRGYDEAERVYFADGRYDHIYFATSEGDDTISIRFDDGDLEVRYNGMGNDLLVLPRSGNELALRVQRRVARG